MGEEKVGLKPDLVYPLRVPTSSMLDQIEKLLHAGLWLGPAVLGALCHRLLIGTPVAAGDDLAGIVLLATSGVLLTAAGIRANAERATIAPLVFGAMFLASWTMR